MSTANAAENQRQEMKSEEIKEIVEKQKKFFHTGVTLDPAYRVKALKRLHTAIKRNEDKLFRALYDDLGKSSFESYMCEVGMTLSELSHLIKKTPHYANIRRAKTPLAQYVSKSFIMPCPYGCTLVMSPWNYPVLLSLEPLADAIAAGNTVVLKPSEYSPHTSKALKTLISECFEPEYVTTVTGGRQENSALLEQPFNYIFFTGSQAVGTEVMRKAAKNLIPVTLELGGKSPCIVDAGANIALAAKRIVFGKFLNCGQTCVAPDYIYCDEKIEDRLIGEIKKQIEHQFGKEPLKNETYVRMINEKHFDRVSGLIDMKSVVIGGETDHAALRISPTVMKDVQWDDKVMGEEIFGPVLPILTYRSVDEVITKLNDLPEPLALYIFSSDKAVIQKILSRCSFGGGCVNDTIIHLATSDMPFGGVGKSGMGGYHGKFGFDTFTHYKSIVDKKTYLDLPMRYQPYTSFHDKLIRMFLK